MYDISIALPGQPGSLARFGEATGAAGVSLEGGGLFTVGGVGHAHFLVEDGEAARAALENAGLGSATVRPVLIRRLKQDAPGQLGAIARALGDVGVNIETQYSDHANRLILVIDDLETAEKVTSDWAARSYRCSREPLYYIDYTVIEERHAKPHFLGRSSRDRAHCRNGAAGWAANHQLGPG